MSMNHTSAIPKNNDQLSLAMQVKQIDLVCLLKNAELFEPVTIGTLIVCKHKGKGFWVREGECQFSVPSISDVLELAEGLMSGELVAVHHLPTGAVRYRGELLVDVRPKRGYAHDADFFKYLSFTRAKSCLPRNTRISRWRK
jgi:hypothetical protein